MRDQRPSLSYLIEDWIDKDSILSQHFHLWPDDEWDVGMDPTRWIMVKSRNCSYIKDGIWIMDPIVISEKQSQTRWVELKPADPQLFEKLRSYLMFFI